MFHASAADCLVPFDGSFLIDNVPTRPTMRQKWRMASRLNAARDRLRELHRMLMANDSHAVLLVFQGMDCSGKDGTIEAVTSAFNPSGFHAANFKEPSDLELDHDFLWRTTCALPGRGRIAVFNRSQYEEVLVVRVRPELLKNQRLPGEINLDKIWDERFESIRDQEKHLARNGTIILKFWLNVSRQEQKKRFLARLDEPRKLWKFHAGDLEEGNLWSAYLRAYEAALNATSRPWAPWYAVPADSKPYMRARIAEIIADALSSVGLSYPQPSRKEREQFDRLRASLSGPETE